MLRRDRTARAGLPTLAALNNGRPPSDLLGGRSAAPVHSDRQTDFFDQLPIRHRAGVLPQHTCSDLGFVGVEPIAEPSDHTVNVHPAETTNPAKDDIVSFSALTRPLSYRSTTIFALPPDRRGRSGLSTVTPNTARLAAINADEPAALRSQPNA